MLKQLLIAILFMAVFSVNVLASTQVRIGSTFPSLTLSTLSGKSYELKPSLNPKIVVFFAQWSKSCRSTLDSLQKIYTQYKDKRLEIVAVSFDNEIDLVKNFLKENKIGFTVIQDRDLLSFDRYEILVIPTTYIVDATGTIKNIFIDFDKNVETSIKKSIAEELAN